MSHQDEVKFLNLLQIRFPVTAIASIMHRVTGVAIFLLIPVLLSLMLWSTESEPHFIVMANSLSQPSIRVLLFLLIYIFSFHIYAGCRHLVMDFGMGDSYKVASRSAWTVILLSGITSVFGGIYV